MRVSESLDDAALEQRFGRFTLGNLGALLADAPPGTPVVLKLEPDDVRALAEQLDFLERIVQRIARAVSA